ncbi:ParA family protein [Marilutibacter alkalisoli]|uniref:ParA family protein n=1 Tax=Marilutibacter alkalisoli TaxID=2591633 RepID=A0A514BWS9_9GAMM|nr:ParA family protein [Lysobacter alkalisoli]QDH71449.1 ParA family protein [Lysobacter alkalisoli]
MKTVLVASSKGGVGKTTIATHLAAQAALDGLNTVLLDVDPQRSSTRWAERRAGSESAVLPLDGTRRKAWRKQLPEDTQRLVIDAPAGAMAGDLEHLLEFADHVVVPVQASNLDLEASVPFLDSLARHPRVRKGELRVGLVGNRLRPWTNASRRTVELLKQWPYPLVGELRDSQAYVFLTGWGKSLFDYHSAKVREHQEDWQPLLRWLRK